MRNRRQYERFIPDQNEPIKIELTGDAINEKTTAKDISIGGVGIYLPEYNEQLQVNVKVAFKITLPIGLSFSGEGVIRHRSGNCPFYFGVEYSDLEKNAIEKIKKYIRYMQSGLGY
ncbi:MAG: PilZ domain-containing protein [Bacteriovoracaceae bacterium]|nr:PilZ domain-containing protein [Bacteriovoracaceae bacterium]